MRALQHAVKTKTAQKDTENENYACENCEYYTDETDEQRAEFRSSCEGQRDLHPHINTTETERHQCTDGMQHHHDQHVFVPLQQQSNNHRDS